MQYPNHNNFNTTEEIIQVTVYGKTLNLIKRNGKFIQPAELKALEGNGSGLKPAVETWWLCRKPLAEASIAANVLTWGTGGINIDACRIELNGDDTSRGLTPAKGWKNSSKLNGSIDDNWKKGRWPANFLLSHAPDCTPGDCAPDCPVRVLDEQSGERKSPNPYVRNVSVSNNHGIYGDKVKPVGETTINYGDAGGVSRYFATFYYAPKASRRERETGLEGMPERPGPTMNDRCTNCGKGRLDGRRPGPCCDNPVYEHVPPAGTVQNHHPTVKPVKLMSYLCKLITPEGGTVLDMFAGSGTTGVAAIQEGFNCILIEQDPEYCDIIRARLAHAVNEINETEVA